MYSSVTAFLHIIDHFYIRKSVFWSLTSKDPFSFLMPIPATPYVCSTVNIVLDL